MKRLFDPDSPLLRALAGFARLVGLNVLFLLCAAPVVTAGASAAALYTLTLRMARQEDGTAPRDFFRAFRENFRSATLLWLLLLAAAALGVLEYILCRGSEASLAVLAPLGLLLLVWCFTAAYVFPLQARFENPVLRTLKNAVLMSFAHLPYTLALAAMNTLPLWLFLLDGELFWRLSVCWAIVGCAGTAYLDSLLLQRIFRRYLPAEEASSPPEEPRR